MSAKSPAVSPVGAYDCFSHGLERMEYESGAPDRRCDWALGWRHPEPCGAGVVVLHGHGSGGDQICTWPQLEPWREALRKNGCGFLSPNLRDNAWMCPEAVTDLADLIVFCKAHFGWRKIVICSGSMGASGGLIFSAVHPELIDGVIALGAATDLASYADWCEKQSLDVCRRIASAIRTSYGNDAGIMRRHSVCANASRLSMPIMLRHGTDDRTIPVSQARRLAGALAEKPDFFYGEIYRGNHDSPCLFMPDDLPRLLETIL